MNLLNLPDRGASAAARHGHRRPAPSVGRGAVGRSVIHTQGTSSLNAQESQTLHLFPNSREIDMKISMVYACTHVSIMSQVDDYEKGCNPNTLICVMAEKANIESDTLAGLVEKIGNEYGLEINDLWIPDDDGNKLIDRIGFSRMEDADGCDVSEQELNDWRAGKLTLYLADYDFRIEKREVSPVPLQEFIEAKIKYYE